MKGLVVVIDAANPVGRAVLQAAFDSGRPVVAVTEDKQELLRLRERQAELALLAPDRERADAAVARLTVIAGSVADETRSAALAASLRGIDRPIAGIVIANCAEPSRGRVLDQPAAELQRRLESELLPQLAAARQLLPVLAEAGRNGGYVLIGGPGSEQPWAGYGYRSVAAAAVSMLVRVLHMEARPLGVRVQMLGVTRPVRTEENLGKACEGWPPARAIAEQALALGDHVDPRQAANAVVRFVQRESAAADRVVLEQTEAHARELEPAWAALEPMLRPGRREDRRK